MLDFVIELLQCPVCQGELHWTITQQEGQRIEAAEALCSDCRSSYPVLQGIGIFLTPDLPRNDLWEQVDSALIRFFKKNPQIERRLMTTPVESLSSVDQFYRAMLLEANGAFSQAKILLETAKAGLYTPETLICQESQVHYLLGQLSGAGGVIVDLASGRGELLEKMAMQLDRPLIATDFSLNVLRRDRAWLEACDLYKKVSLLAFDARRSPFKDGAVETMTTYMGLSNIEKPERLLKELRRVVAGKLFAITVFYPEDDAINAAAIENLGLSSLLYRASAQQQFEAAGWTVNSVNSCAGRARPTPKSELLEGAGIDQLPVAETNLEWVNLLAR